MVLVYCIDTVCFNQAVRSGGCLWQLLCEGGSRALRVDTLAHLAVCEPALQLNTRHNHRLESTEAVPRHQRLFWISS